MAGTRCEGGGKENRPLVSLIIPCYNAKAYLAQALASAEDQSYPNLEIICVDDGSTDGTPELLSRFQSRSRREVKVIPQENRGVSAARNAGIRAASGTYLAFLDADDRLSRDFVRLLAEGLTNTGAEIAYGNWTGHDSLAQDCSKLPGEAQTGIEAFRHFMYRDFPLSFFTYMYRADFLAAQGIAFPEDLRYGEDSAFLLQYLSRVKTALGFRAGIYYYRPNENSAMHSVKWAQTDVIRSSLRVADMLEREGFPLAREFRDYMPARATLSAAKIFAAGKDRRLYGELNRKYSIRSAARALIGKNGAGLTAAALVALANPMLFYHTAGWMDAVRKRID